MTASPRVVALVTHPERPQALEVARRTAEWLQARGIEVRLPEGVASDLPGVVCSGAALLDGLDLVISLGGDGTMLRAVDLVFDHGVPVLGVNVGQLGYLTEVEPPALEDALTRLVDGDYEVTERMVLEVVVDGEGRPQRWWALNEAVLEKDHPGQLARLAVLINGSFFTTYAADGVIVSTPTGSTAYSFSARGPIVSPRHRCLLLTPVSPHMLFDRALVLDPHEELRFVVEGDRPIVLIVDGREVGSLAPGTAVTCTADPRPAHIVTLGPRDFHQILKAKFGLADR